MSLENIKATLRLLTGSFLNQNIEVLKDLIDLYNKGTDRNTLITKLKEKGTYNNKQMKALLHWTEQFAKNPKELQYLFEERAVTPEGKLSQPSINHFLLELRNLCFAFEGKNLGQQKTQLQAVGIAIKKLKAVIDTLHKGTALGAQV